MISYKKIIKNRELRLKVIHFLRFIPDDIYLKVAFYIKTGKILNLSSPTTFCDKQNWLKLNNIHPEYSQLVDKLAVRKIVNEKLSGEYFFPILGVWDNYEDIDFNLLPAQFVLKCNHDSRSIKIIQNKNEINHDELRKFYTWRLKFNFDILGREYPYRGIVPKIFAEQYMTDNEKEIYDYKFFCFNGKPEIVMVCIN